MTAQLLPTKQSGNLYLINFIEFVLIYNQFIIVIILEDRSVHERYLTIHNLLALSIARNAVTRMPRAILAGAEHKQCYHV